MVVVLVMGGPGAGKTTLCASLAARWPCVAHVAAGELLRAASTGVRYPPGQWSRREQVCGLVAAALRAQPQDRLCLVDGFPREAAALQLWEREGGWPRLVLLLEASEELRTARCAARSSRIDSSREKIRIRMQIYRQETQPLQDLLRNRGIVRLVDAEQPSLEVLLRAESILKQENLLRLY